MNNELAQGDVADDQGVLSALRAGCEQTFAALVHRHHGSLLRFVQGFTRNAATAEEIVQEAWCGFLASLDRFEGRCALKTWLYQIAANKARTRASRESRSVPFSALVAAETEADEVSVPETSFRGPDRPWPRHWEHMPARWARDAYSLAEDREAVELVRAAVAELPPAQATVMRLRDIDGLDSEEVCNVLGISETNQRVLLHRARTKVRRALAARYEERR